MLFDSTLRRDLSRTFGATLVVILTIVITMFLIRTLGQAAGGSVSPQDVVLLLGYISLEHLPTILRNDTRSSSLRDDTLAGRLSLEKAVMEFEREIILDALKKNNYVQTHAATQLGISRRMLKYRMDTLGIGRPDNDPTPVEPEPPVQE